MDHVSQAQPGWHFKNYVAEGASMTAFMAALVGLLVAIFHPGWPLASALPGLRPRLFLLGLLLGLGIYALSKTALGKLSGPQLDPVFTLALWAQGKMPWRDCVGFACAQFAGALAGVGLSRLAFGPMVAVFHYGALAPNKTLSFATVFAAEGLATFVFVGVLLACVCVPRLQRYTMAMFIVLLPVIVCIDAPISGSGINPARWLGSAVFHGDYQNAAVYVLAPLLGTLLAIAAVRLGTSSRAKTMTTADVADWSKAA